MKVNLNPELFREAMKYAMPDESFEQLFERMLDHFVKKEKFLSLLTNGAFVDLKKDEEI